MNYVQEVKLELEKESNVHSSLLDLYTLLVFTKGVNCTLKDVHDAWSVWKNNRMPEHRSLVAFEQLSETVQELDTVYCEAIKKVAEKML